VKELSLEQLKQIYTGQIKNWKVLGGKDLQITVVSKAEGRSTLELFLSFFQLKPTELKASVIIGDNEQGIKTVSGNVGSIGYVSVGTAVFQASNGAKIKVLPMNGIEPNAETIRSGKFPMSRPLNLVTSKTPAPNLKPFIEYAQSTAVKSIVEGQYFVTLK
jgi:phosphate transport system substrate-binding protein